MIEKEINISASKLDTFESCSWMYWCKYHLKLPDQGNLGSKKGNVCHGVFEALLKENNKRQLYVDQIKNDKTCKNIPSLWRYINSLGKKEGLFDSDHFAHVDEMIYAAVKEGDFIPDRSKYDVIPEQHFKYQIHKNIFINGFIDVKIINKKTGEILIRDYKSSKEKFAPKKIISNFQGMMYALSVYKETGVVPDVCFWFLQYPNNIRQMMPRVTASELNGYEAYLKYAIAEQMDKFSHVHAKLGYAKNKPKPDKDEGFTGCLKCGFAKHKGQLKKDGSKMWACDFKFGFDYFVVRDNNGEIIKKSHYIQDLQKHYPLNKIEKLNYSGCPAHK